MIFKTRLSSNLLLKKNLNARHCNALFTAQNTLFLSYTRKPFAIIFERIFNEKQSNQAKNSYQELQKKIHEEKFINNMRGSLKVSVKFTTLKNSFGKKITED